MSQTTHEVLAASLDAHGVTHLFGLVGDANLFMVNAFVASGKGRYVACTHEANAVLAALGYAQARDTTGVATITHGPALTNVVTALTEGVRGGIPLVLLCGDTPPGDTEHLQRVDQRELVKATGAGFVEMRSPDTAAADLALAFRRAALERRPVVFNSRVDLQWAAVSEAAQVPVVYPVPVLRAAPPEGDAFDEAAGMIASARRPLILAGLGASAPGARAAILRLAERLEAPVATTLKAAGLFHGAPFDLGVFGGLSQPATTEVILKSDCVIAFGASLSRQTTESGSLLQGKRVVQILADAHENPRRTEPTVLLIGDPELTANHLVDMMDMAEIPPSSHTGPDMQQLLAQQAAERAGVPPFAATKPGTVDLAPALRRLDQALPADRVLVADLGRFVTTAWQNLSVSGVRDLIYTAHFGSIGLGLAEAVGAATANPGRKTVLVVGDGGFMLGGYTELTTVVRKNLDLVIILCNDGSYGAEHIQFTRRGMDPGLSLLSRPDFPAIARALGLRAVTITSPDDLDNAAAMIAEAGLPLLIELRLDPACIEM